MKNLIAFIVIAIALTSCEYSFNYSYTVTNNTDSIIVIHIRTYRIDTIYNLMKGTKEKVYMTDHGIEGAKGPYFQNVHEDLDSFIVTKNGIQSNRNFLENSNWDFESGDYKTIITNSEF